MEHYTEGVIFDFNGTLYYDDDINDITWKKTIIDMVGPGYDYDYLLSEVRAQKNSRLIRNVHKLIGKEIRDEDVEMWSKRKEVCYRQTCLDLGRNKKPDGAVELLDYLKEHNIPVNLCTNSRLDNVEFYFKNVELYKWFDFSKVVYDTGKYADKVEMYRDAAKNIGCDIRNCVVFEDSKGSIKEAIEAGCTKIFAMQKKDHGGYKEILQELADFTELDYDLLGLKK